MQFVVVLDISVVSLALPSVQASLGFTEAGLQWVISGYALTFGASYCPPGGVCGLAPSADVIPASGSSGFSNHPP